MTLVLLSILFVTTWNSCLVSSSNYLSYVAGGKKYSSYAHSRSVSMEYSLYCQIEAGCVCNQERDGYVLHCEREVHARMSVFAETEGSLDLQCNSSLSSDDIRHDYYHTLGLDDFEEIRVRMYACPEPPESYVALFTPSRSLINSEQMQLKASIKVLIIDCGQREQFHFTREHFAGLNDLEYLEITCTSLQQLPDDLFQERLQNLFHLKISRTMIESIPDGLLHSIPTLKELMLESNRIKEIRNLNGSNALDTLTINEPMLTSIGSDIFEHTPNLERLSLKNSLLTVLPRSIGKLVNLISINLIANKIEGFEKDHCSMLKKLNYFRSERNPLKRVHFECFSKLEDLHSLHFIGASLTQLPEKLLIMNNLTSFTFEENTQSISNVFQFINSETLTELEMDGSKIKSFAHDFLHGFPSLKAVILKNNELSFLHEDFFSENPNLKLIHLGNNKIAVIPPNLFLKNSNLEILLLENNSIYELPSSLLSNCSSLYHLRVGGNMLKEIPKNFLSNLDKLLFLNISNNNISKLESDCFAGLSSLDSIDISNNILNDSKMIYFEKLSNPKLRYLNLYGNDFDTIPTLVTSLKYLNMSRNNLKVLDVKNFRHDSKLQVLDLSRNFLQKMTQSVFLGFRHLIILDLSFNQLSEIPSRALYLALRLEKLLLSRNKIERFDISIICNNRYLEELDLSGNDLRVIRDFGGDCNGEVSALKKLNLAHNKITFADSIWVFDKYRRTWGRISPLIYFPKIEEIILVNNSISTIFIDWRNMLVSLRVLDLRYNKIKYLTHQDMLYPTCILDADGIPKPLKCSHSLKVDLRHNLISGMELPKNMLEKKTKGERFSTVTMMLEDNPFNCGCGVINVLRLLEGDVFLTSELQRTKGVNWISQATIEPGNLSCWLPETVRGKKVTKTNTWMHHIIPMFGMCSIMEDW